MEEDGDEKTIPLITFKLYAPYSPEQYEVMLDIDAAHIEYYYTLAQLIEHEGPDCDYIEDYIPLFEDLFAN